MIPKVVIQMLVCDRGEGSQDAHEALASLEAVAYPRDWIEIVVLDNSPPPRELALELRTAWTRAAHPNLPVLTVIRAERNLGFAGGHAFLCEEAQRRGAEYLLLLNEDARLAPDAIERAVEEMESKSQTAIGQLRIRLEQDHARYNSLGNCLHIFGFGFTDEDGTRPHFYASGAVVMVRTSVLETIGGLFDPFYFLYHEDVDLSWRARLAGFDVAVLQAEAFHRYEFSRSMTKFFWMERNRWLTALTHWKLFTLILLMPGMLGAEALLFVLSFFSPWGKEKRRAYREIFKKPFWMFVWQRRKTIKRIRRRSDREMLELMVDTLASEEVKSALLERFVNPMLKAYGRFLRWAVRW